jgi:predicted alpha/beta hydrolase
VLSVQYLLWSVGVYGLVFWLPAIVKHLTGRGDDRRSAVSRAAVRPPRHAFVSQHDG